MIASILLVPSKEHRDALLGDGPCDARVPAMIRILSDFGQHTGCWQVPHDRDRVSDDDLALILAYDGVPVPEGCDRAARAITNITASGTGPRVLRYFSPLGTYHLERPYPMGPYGLMELASAWGEMGATVILLDPEGREVQP